MAQIIADENVPRSVINWLKKKDLNVVTISEVNLRGAKDKAIAEFAAKNSMTILTLDNDFAQLYFNLQRGKMTVILVKATPSTPANIIEVLEATLDRINIAKIQNKLVLITRKKIRIIS